MSRPKRRLLPADSFPPQLAKFNVADWWVRDPDDDLEVQYARIRWSCARRAYEVGEDWLPHLEPPEWWPEQDN